MRSLRFIGLASLVLATGCYSTHSLTVVPREILRHVPALRDQGEAVVDTLDGTEYRLDAKKKVTIEVDGEPITQSVGEFVANCPDIPPFAGDTYRREKPCYLLDTSTSQIAVEKTSSFDGGKTRTLINTIVFLGGGVGLGFCLSECATEGKIAAGAGLVGLGLYGFLLFVSTKVAVGYPHVSSAVNTDTEGNVEIEPGAVDIYGSEPVNGTEYSDIDAEEEKRAGEIKPGFINSLPGHGSYFQLSLGNGSGIPNSTARRMSVRASTADGRIGHSLALHVARFDDDFAPEWGKPVAEYQISYVLPYDGPGVFFVRAGGAIPLGHDNPESALASAAAVVQSPNDAIFVLPSTVTARGSVSWLIASGYLVSQIDFGIDLGLFGYEPSMHPVLHANAALGIEHKGFMVAAEASTALPWTGALTDMVVTGGALYGTISDTKIGLFVGRQDDTLVVRGRVQYEY